MMRFKLPVSIFSLVLTIFCLAFSVSAQNVTTQVKGLVKDTNDAIVPGVKVTLIDTQTKDEKSVTTKEDGTFVITDVRVGTYSITAEGAGFKKLQVTNIEAHVDQTINLSLVLEAGDIAATVSVTASEAQSLIRSEDAKLSTTIDVKQGSGSALKRSQPDQPWLVVSAGVNTNTNIRQSGHQWFARFVLEHHLGWYRDQRQPRAN
jgi:hypothetical protein